MIRLTDRLDMTIVVDWNVKHKSNKQTTCLITSHIEGWVIIYSYHLDNKYPILQELISQERMYMSQESA